MFLTNTEQRVLKTRRRSNDGCSFRVYRRVFFLRVIVSSEKSIVCLTENSRASVTGETVRSNILTYIYIYKTQRV